MIRYSIYIIFIISLLATIRGKAQTDFGHGVQRKLSAYYNTEAGPKAYIIFNQPEYHPGDTAFFKAYLLTSAGNAFMKGWQVIDLFVTDDDNAVVLRNRTSIKNGTGASQFAIPRNAREGRYTLIVAQPDLNKASRHPVALRASFIVSGKKLQKSVYRGAFAAHPEGGKLIGGVSNNVVVTGLSPGDTAVLESSGSQPRQIGISESGIGKFSFTPKTNENYFLRHNDKRIPVGQIAETGVAIAVTSRKEINSLDVTLRSISANNAPALHLVCINKNTLVDVFPVGFDNDGRATFTLPLPLLPRGVNRLSVLDDEGNIYADRFFYTSQNVLPPTKTQNTYPPRTIVDFEISLPKELSSRNVNGAISVYKKDLFPAKQESTLEQLMTFTDLKTEIPLSTGMSEQVVNDLLVTAIPTIEWKNIWTSSSQEQKPMFSSFFKGKIVLPTGAVASDSSLITFWLKNQDFIYHVYAPTQGRFSFPLFTEFTDDEILYTVSHQQSHIPEARLVLDSVTVPTNTDTALTYSEKENPYAQFSWLRSAVQKSYGYFQRNDNDDIVRPYVESIPTDALFPIEKFKDFANVAEMVNEVVPVVKARKIGSRYELRVFLREFAMHASANPLVMIDGVITDSIDYLMNMNPNQIKTLGVVNSRNKLVRYGALGRNGIITVETTRTEIQNLRSLKSVFVKGIDVPVEFGTESLKQIKHRTPSLRSALYWDPNVTLTQTSSYTGQFKTSDDVGEYVIMFTGIDEKGFPVEITKSFSVRYTAE